MTSTSHEALRGTAVLETGCCSQTAPRGPITSGYLPISAGEGRVEGRELGSNRYQLGDNGRRTETLAKFEMDGGISFDCM